MIKRGKDTLKIGGVKQKTSKNVMNSVENRGGIGH
jgi:hypothetical protein